MSRSMTVVLAPDKFKGCLDAPAVAAALAAGIASVAPSATVRVAPVADGGEGTLAAVLAAGWHPVTAAATGPVGDPLVVTYARRGQVALIESATVAGLGVLPAGLLRPLESGTHGLGQVVAHALDGGASEIVIGLGGSAGTDGGAGLLTGLGARVLDDLGRELPGGGAALRSAAHLDLTGLHPRAPGARFTFLCDVDNPLLGPRGAAVVYGPQKGADPDQVRLLEDGLTRWAALLRSSTGHVVADLAGAGAAGGTPAGALAVLGARLSPGIDAVLALIGFADIVRGADVVITGEGRLDDQTLHGKAPAGVAAAARAAGAAVHAVAGACTLDAEALRAAGFAGVHALTDLAPDAGTAIRDASLLLRRVGATIASDHLVRSGETA
jgi:glycerate kinase